MAGLATPKPRGVSQSNAPNGVPPSRANPWPWLTVAWIGVIFFSSTSLASKWAESFFTFLSGEFLKSLKHNSSSYDVIHLLADKGFHVSLFCILAMFLWLAIRRLPRKPAVIILCGAVVGSASEFLQRFFPDRDPALRDVLINIGGTALGVLVCYAATRRRVGRRPVSVA